MAKRYNVIGQKDKRKRVHPKRTKSFPIKKYNIAILLPVNISREESEARVALFTERLDNRDLHLPKNGRVRVKVENEITIGKEDKDGD